MSDEPRSGRVWLVVLDLNWSYASTRFGPVGAYDVSEMPEIVASVKKDDYKGRLVLVYSDTPPEIDVSSPGSRLERHHLSREWFHSTQPRIVTASREVMEDMYADPVETDVRRTYPCPLGCDIAPFPHPGPAALHAAMSCPLRPEAQDLAPALREQMLRVAAEEKAKADAAREDEERVIEAERVVMVYRDSPTTEVPPWVRS